MRPEYFLKTGSVPFWLFAASLCLFLLPLNAQKDVVDSLKEELKSVRNDTSRCAILYAMTEAENDDELWPVYNEEIYSIAEKNLRSFPDKKSKLRDRYLWYMSEALMNRGVLNKERGDHKLALQDYKKCLSIKEQLTDKTGIAVVLNNLAMLYKNDGQVTEALDYYKRSLEMLKELGDKKRAAYSMSNLAGVYSSVGDIARAISFYEESIKTFETEKDLAGVGITHNNIGSLYLNQGEWGKASQNYRMSLSIMEKLGDSPGIAQCLNNIGYVLNLSGDADSAMKCYSTSLRIRQRLGLKPGIAQSYLQIGLLQKSRGRDLEARESFLSALSIFEQLNDKAEISNSLVNLAELSHKKGNYKEALNYAQGAMALAREIGYPDFIRSSAKALYTTYKTIGDNANALLNYELYITMRDSVLNTATRKAAVRSQLKYQYEKRAAADSVRNAEVQKVKDAQLLAQGVKLKQERMQFWFVVLGLLFVGAGLVAVINRFRITRKQKRVIEEQKQQVDDAYEKLTEKNKEVLDSIQYARRIQRALITNERYIDKNLKRLHKN